MRSSSFSPIALAMIALGPLATGASAAQPIRVGEPTGPQPEQSERLAIDFDAVDLNGDAFRGRELRGRIVLLDFWAVWCAPCLDAFPKLTALARELADEPFHIVGVALYSGDHEDVREFLEPYTADYTVVVGDNDLSFRYGVIGYPTYLLIDPGGNVYKKYVGALSGLEERVKQDVVDLKARYGLQ